ncbi:MAG: hypothetical protein ACXU61_06535, partial [Croceibacterium sp.]
EADGNDRYCAEDDGAIVFQVWKHGRKALCVRPLGVQPPGTIAGQGSDERCIFIDELIRPQEVSVAIAAF